MRLVVGFFFAGLAALGAAPTPAASDCTVIPSTTVQMAVLGPYPVGRLRCEWEDTSRSTLPSCSSPGATSRKLTTEIWYPAQVADPGAVDSSGAPYPVVIHSHGIGGSRLDQKYLAEELASRGYVVAAPSYPLSSRDYAGGLANVTRLDLPNQPSDWSFVLDKVLAKFGATVDPARVGASGLSLGGLTTLLVTYHRDLRDPRIVAALAMASPGGCIFTRTFFQTTRTPLLLLQGDSDFLAPFGRNGKRLYGLAGPPKQLVRLRNGSHANFTELAPGEVVACVGFSNFPCNPDFDPADPFPGLGGADVGIDPYPSRCKGPCDPAPTADTPAAMSAALHHELTEIVAVAFFDSELRGDAAARDYLQHSLALEYPDDVRVRTRPAAP